ncbi:uncharacterized protein EI90DRAFT_3124609 [Cantharellus anzutake]|uniref:uncharacterized protein n=1 Tax=Cantharellus anzutake TaxID=1750568 RepID=UPI001905692F|nr:uncharacterized protein EI90DRAFT_3124609 [Cantharellus anzutake]KAF8330163.1 hypothetical protein EI90DRAFT_3124609 [Cantharellus anzutake]
METPSPGEQVVTVAIESFSNNVFINWLAGVANNGRLGCIMFDEAHGIVEDQLFRPAYLDAVRKLMQLQNAPILFTSGTMSRGFTWKFWKAADLLYRPDQSAVEFPIEAVYAHPRAFWKVKLYGQSLRKNHEVMFRVWLAKDNKMEDKVPNKWHYMFSVMHGVIKSKDPAPATMELGSAWRAVEEKEMLPLQDVWRSSELAEAIEDLLTIPCWRECEKVPSSMERWTHCGMHQLSALVQPRGVTSVTALDLALSWSINFQHPPRWTAVLDNKPNAIYSQGAISEAKRVPDGFRNALQDRKSNTWGFLPDDFLHPAYLQANNSRVNLEMSKIRRTFILLVYIVFGEKQAKKMMSRMKGHGGRRKQEDVDAFHFTQDNEELFWDTALPKLCVAKGHNTDGLLEEILLSHLIRQGTVDATFKKQDVDEMSDNLDRFDVARITDMVRRNEGWWALLRRFAGWKDKAYHFISGVVIEAASPDCFQELRQVSEAVVEQLDGAVDKYYDSIYHLGQLSSHHDEVEKSREMVQRKRVELDREERELDEAEEFNHQLHSIVEDVLQEDSTAMNRAKARYDELPPIPPPNNIGDTQGYALERMMASPLPPVMASSLDTTSSPPSHNSGHDDSLPSLVPHSDVDLFLDDLQFQMRIMFEKDLPDYDCWNKAHRMKDFLFRMVQEPLISSAIMDGKVTAEDMTSLASIPPPAQPTSSSSSPQTTPEQSSRKRRRSSSACPTSKKLRRASDQIDDRAVVLRPDRWRQVASRAWVGTPPLTIGPLHRDHQTQGTAPVGTQQDDCDEDATEDPSSDEPDAAGSMLEELPDAALPPLDACQEDTSMLDDLYSQCPLKELLSDGWEWDADSMPEDLWMGQDGPSGGVTVVESQGVGYEQQTSQRTQVPGTSSNHTSQSDHLLGTPGNVMLNRYIGYQYWSQEWQNE